MLTCKSSTFTKKTTELNYEILHLSTFKNLNSSNPKTTHIAKKKPHFHISPGFLYAQKYICHDNFTKSCIYQLLKI